MAPLFFERLPLPKPLPKPLVVVASEAVAAEAAVAVIIINRSYDFFLRREPLLLVHCTALKRASLTIISPIFLSFSFFLLFLPRFQVISVKAENESGIKDLISEARVSRYMVGELCSGIWLAKEWLDD